MKALAMTHMGWLYLLIAAVLIWALCGAVIAVGRRLWTLDTTLLVHVALAPLISFCISLLHARLAPESAPIARAAVVLAVVILLDAGLVATLLEKSYAMFKSVIGTWLPFALIFLASWAAGVVAS